MAYRIRSDGFFRNVNGVPVRVRRLPGGFYTGWPNAPRGVMLHGTAGCSNDIFSVLQSRGISVHFCVGRDGSITQYVSMRDRAAHAYDANHTHYAIEHTGQHSSCKWYTAKQLASSVKLSAAIVEYLKKTQNIDVPLDHVHGWDLQTRGFKEHYCGTLPTAPWNPNVHVDRPGTYWGWNRYLDLVKDHLVDVQRSYRYGGKTYNSVRNVVRRLKRGLKNADVGEAHEVTVRKRAQQG